MINIYERCHQCPYSLRAEYMCAIGKQILLVWVRFYNNSGCKSYESLQ